MMTTTTTTMMLMAVVVIMMTMIIMMMMITIMMAVTTMATDGTRMNDDGEENGEDDGDTTSRRYCIHLSGNRIYLTEGFPHWHGGVSSSELLKEKQNSTAPTPTSQAQQQQSYKKKTITSTDSDYCAFAPNVFGKLPRIQFPETIKLRIRGFFRARKNSCRTCHSFWCRKVLWLQVGEAVWSNCKQTQSSKSRLFPRKKY